MNHGRMDIVTVFHNETNYREHLALVNTIGSHEEAKGGLRVFPVDNRVNNRGFAAGCNLGAFDPRASAPVIGFLNPDTLVDGPFVDAVLDTLRHEPDIVITGCDFGKSSDEVKSWGCDRWVCGAAFFVRRDWFTQVGGFDEQFVWGWEETDLIRRAQNDRKQVRPIGLPLRHDSPDVNSPADVRYKNQWFETGAVRYKAKWSMT